MNDLIAAASSRIIETRWWWVRHAPVPDEGRIYGQRDLDCDCSEETVYRAVAAVLPHDAVWLTSALKRTKQTAAAIHAASEGRHAPREMPGHDAFNEQHLGDWQGRDRHAFLKQQGFTAMRFWLTVGDQRAPGGESYPDVVNRVSPVIEALTEMHAGKNIISVAHGGTIRAAIGFALGGPHDMAHAFTIDNCSITVLEHLRDPGQVGDGVWRVGAVNNKPWLPGLSRRPHS